jgi:hypothetical protein
VPPTDDVDHRLEVPAVQRLTRIIDHHNRRIVDQRQPPQR